MVQVKAVLVILLGGWGGVRLGYSVRPGSNERRQGRGRLGVRDGIKLGGLTTDGWIRKSWSAACGHAAGVCADGLCPGMTRFSEVVGAASAVVCARG